MRQSTSNHSQRGFTLVEMSIALIVIGVAASAVMTAYQSTERSAREREYVQHYITLDKAIKQTHQSGDYSGLSVAGVLASGAIPERYAGKDRDGNPAILSPSGTPVTIGAHTLTGRVAGSAYQVSYEEVPSGECSALRSTLSGVAEDIEIPTSFRGQEPCSSKTQSVTIRSR